MIRDVMAKFDQEISKLIARYRQMMDVKHAKRPPGEVDTEVLLVEPVLALAGWRVEDIAEIQRTKPSEKWDVIARVGEHDPPRLVIEVKPLRGDWLGRRNRDGSGGRIKLPVSALKDPHTTVRDLHPFASTDRFDAIGQLRVCCLKLLDKNDYQPGYTIPVLTDGRRWLIFDSKKIHRTKQT
jgi:hypothetical protein